MSSDWIEILLVLWNIFFNRGEKHFGASVIFISNNNIVLNLCLKASRELNLKHLLKEVTGALFFHCQTPIISNKRKEREIYPIKGDGNEITDGDKSRHSKCLIIDLLQNSQSVVCNGFI